MATTATYFGSAVDAGILEATSQQVASSTVTVEQLKAAKAALERMVAAATAEPTPWVW